MKKPELTIDGIPVRMERRRYDRTFYTWVYADINADPLLPWVGLGDPWPCAVPAHAEIREALWIALRGRTLPAQVKVNGDR